MTKGKKSAPKTTDASSESLRRALRFGRGESGQAEDDDGLGFESLEAFPEAVTSIEIQGRAHQIPRVRISKPRFHYFHGSVIFVVNEDALQSLRGEHI